MPHTTQIDIIMNSDGSATLVRVSRQGLALLVDPFDDEELARAVRDVAGIEAHIEDQNDEA